MLKLFTMLSLLILIIFGLGVAYFATQNTGTVHMQVANYLIADVPLYVIVIGSMLLGIFVSWLISMVDSISSNLRIHGKDTELKKAYRTIESLKKDNNTLLIENTQLKGEQKQSVEHRDVVEKAHEHEEYNRKPSFLHRLTHGFT